MTLWIRRSVGAQPAAPLRFSSTLSLNAFRPKAGCPPTAPLAIIPLDVLTGLITRHVSRIIYYESMATAVLTVHNLSKSFVIHPVFADVSFVVNEVDRVALVGPNGVGKSTLLKI